MTTDTNTSVHQVFDVLDVLSSIDAPVGVSQLARRLGVPTSTAHRVLATLNEAGYAARDTTGTEYQLGLGAQELTHALIRRFPIQLASQPLLRPLASDTGDTVVLTCRVGWYGVRMAAIEGWREIHTAPRLGQATLLERTAGGRSILAFLDDAMRSDYVRWRAGGKRPNAALRAVRADLAAVAREGKVLDRQDDGRTDIALPVRDPGGRIIASIAVESAEPDTGARAERSRVARVQAVVGELETLVRREPNLAADPFAHLAPADLDPGIDPGSDS
jgi:IclR family transcriptional regulator, KDG regulon repressor